MRLLLMAASDVGRRVARILGTRDADVACLVIDELADDENNRMIIEATNPELVIANGRLTLSSLPEHLDLGITAWWHHILPREVVSVPRLGFLNLHPSLLPHGRGKHPNFWSIIEGSPYGATIHHIGEKIDAGPIAWQREIEVGWTDTGATLHLRAQQEIVALFEEHVDEILAGTIPATPQDVDAGSFHLAKEIDPYSRIEIDREYSARALLNLLRARTYAPHPAAWFEDGGRKYEVRIEIEEQPE